MPTKRHLIDIATRHQVFLERLKAGQAGDFAKVFDKIDKATREILLALDADNIGELTRKQLQGVLNQLYRANHGVLKGATEDLFKNLEELADYEQIFEGVTLKHFLRKNRVAMPTAHAGYMNALSSPMSSTGQLLKVFVDSWSDGELNRLNNTVQKAWGEGWTLQKTVQNIRGTKKLNYTDGVISISKRNAESVARTSLQHVAQSARMATWEANNDIVKRYRYVATLDGRTTQVCRSLDGKTFPLNQGPKPPVHINCRSTTVAELDPALGLGFLDEGATRSALGGSVPAEQSYYDWLKNQPAEFQDEAIGKTRAKLFRDGGLSADQFAKLNLGRNFHPLTLNEMRKLEPLAFKRAGLDNK